MTLLSAPAIKEPFRIGFHAPERFFMTAAARRMAAWSRMASKQKLADMEKEDRRRKVSERGRK